MENYRSDYYQNEYLDRAIALMIIIVFLVALFYAVTIIMMYWAFFRVLFLAVVVALVVWIVTMLFSVIWRYNATTQAILEGDNIPLQLSTKVKREKVPIYRYDGSEGGYSVDFPKDDED